jgi:accessory gene regulator B
MFLIEKVSNKIGETIAENLILDDDNKEILIYGAFCFLQTIISFTLIFIFSYIFNVLVQAIFISFSGSILRKYSGGVHSSSPNKCLIISILISVGFSKLLIFFTKNLPIIFPYLFILLGIIYSFYCILKFAPVDSVSKPINSIIKRKKLKINSIIFLSVFTFIAFILSLIYMFKSNINFLIYSECIILGVTWQSFSLTNLGHKFLTKIDTILIIP